MLLGMRSRLPALIVIGALLVLAAVVAAGASAVPVGQGRPLFEFLHLPVITVIDPQVPPPEDARERTWPAWTQWLGWFLMTLPITLLVAAIIAAVLVGLLARRIRFSSPGRVAPGGPGVAGTPAAELLEAARAAQAELARHEGGPPADAVIAAWVRLEETAARAGSPRLAHQTPTEFTDTLSGRPAIGAALDGLRGLYQRARFAPGHTVGAADAEAARVALAEIVHELSAARSAT